MPRIYMALRQEDRLPITDIMAQTPAIPDNCQWGLFLRNHDELTLEMVTADERDYMYIAYSTNLACALTSASVAGSRPARQQPPSHRVVELASAQLSRYTILYYGDEIAWRQHLPRRPQRHSYPMQWNSDRNAGFSKCDPAQLYFHCHGSHLRLPSHQCGSSTQRSVEPTALDPQHDRLAQAVPGLRPWNPQFLEPANRKILAYLRDLKRGDGSHETVLCVANLSRFAQPVSLDLADHSGTEPVEMLGYVPFPLSPKPLTSSPSLRTPSSGSNSSPKCETGMILIHLPAS